MPWFGHIEGVNPGQTWRKRAHVTRAGVHTPLQSGISGSHNAGGAYSMILNNADHDIDCGDIIWYMGNGGYTRPGTKRMIKRIMQHNQDPNETQNRALYKSLRSCLPVRVVRGGSGSRRSPWAPQYGYRYDGLYEVTHAGKVNDPSGETSYTCEVFRMERLVRGEKPLYSVPIRPGQAARALEERQKGSRRKSLEDDAQRSLPRAHRRIADLPNRPPRIDPSHQSKPSQEPSAFLQPVHDTAVESPPRVTLSSIKIKRCKPTPQPVDPHEDSRQSSAVLHACKADTVFERQAKQDSHCSVDSADGNLPDASSDDLRPHRLLSPLPLDDFTWPQTRPQKQPSRPASPLDTHSFPPMLSVKQEPPASTPYAPRPKVTHSPVQPLSKAVPQPAWHATPTTPTFSSESDSRPLELKAFIGNKPSSKSDSIKLEIDDSQPPFKSDASAPSGPLEAVPAGKKEEEDPKSFGIEPENLPDCPQNDDEREEAKWKTTRSWDFDGTETISGQQVAVEDERGVIVDGSVRMPVRRDKHQTESTASSAETAVGDCEHPCFHNQNINLDGDPLLSSGYLSDILEHDPLGSGRSVADS
ncbi:uncharacterized protein PGTG_08386 [Puccinia graminis f. sp. tritici CRL 75-36-700-3]|uniref:YDG domain-containing protein n=1 Tax=Puccinia graminis f. sp. tritici (strain CRL 75-36-700-3 / race SCCL) TaxID=418459 RepID=E3KDJ4_PUCGT|nr:uncharacterized protein PGTG_08386 [Puccinia graminis f. sp. tritici CRL 75-36-700-3]EFP82430.2 hypothetical protein PGTG_08386 [Puccinia graminis f. sp. tritici CRL 75-36-700-3]